MSLLGEVRGTVFANSWEFITISKENVTKIFNEKNERRKPYLPKTFILHRVVLFSGCFIRNNLPPSPFSPDIQHTVFLKSFQSNERCLRVGRTGKLLK